MAIFRSLVTVTLLLVSLYPAHQARAQQAMPTVDQAKKEGEVVWYGTLTGGSIVGNIIKNFESKFPGIKVKYLRLGGASFVERIRSEARAGKYLWDVVTSEYIQFSELSKHVALARYAAPDTAQISPRHRDPNGTWVSIYGAIATIAWNTRMVKPAEAPKDWKDLLDPRWKGKKIGLPVEAFQWYGGMVTYLGDKAGRDFMKALAAQDPQTQARLHEYVESAGCRRISRGHHSRPSHRRRALQRRAGGLVRGGQSDCHQHPSGRYFGKSDAPGGGAAVLRLSHLGRRAKPFTEEGLPVPTPASKRVSRE